MKARCCYPGCENLKIAGRGYRVGFGFMLWACDDHAQMYIDFDRKLQDYERGLDKALEDAVERAEEQYFVDNPYPGIDYQQSVQLHKGGMKNGSNGRR